MEKIIEGNVKIAKFLGYSKEYYTSNQVTLTYHSDWSELMPVIIKISKILTPENGVVLNGNESYFDSYYPRTFGMINSENGNFMFRINRFPLHQSKSLIEATFNAVVEFIDWYNNHVTDKTPLKE